MPCPFVVCVLMLMSLHATTHYIVSPCTAPPHPNFSRRSAAPPLCYVLPARAVVRTSRQAEKAPFKYQALFHTYYSVPDCTAVVVHVAAPPSGSGSGAAGEAAAVLDLHDKMTPAEPFKTVEAPHHQVLAEEVDRIFHSVAPTIVARLSASRQVRIVCGVVVVVCD
jgi:hypothetical protein